MRIAGCSEPVTLTSATPEICDRRCASIVSAASKMVLAGTLSEVKANIITGNALGLAFRKTGSTGRSLGKSVAAALRAACTSRAALSAFRPGSN